jgi:hypothetical protein
MRRLLEERARCRYASTRGEMSSSGKGSGAQSCATFLSMRMTRVLQLAYVLGVTWLPFANAQTLHVEDPYRSFIGQWRGVAVINPSHERSPVNIVISESPDRSKMLWEYNFGLKGQNRYHTTSKLFSLDPLSESMISQWLGEQKVVFTTTGLLDFARSGYGTFEGSTSYTKSEPFRFSKHGMTRITIELSQFTMSYTWDVTMDGKTTPYSKFVFDRVASQTNASPSGTHQ